MAKFEIASFDGSDTKNHSSFEADLAALNKLAEQKRTALMAEMMTEIIRIIPDGKQQICVMQSIQLMTAVQAIGTSAQQLSHITEQSALATVDRLLGEVRKSIRVTYAANGVK